MERIYCLADDYRHTSGSTFFVFKGFNEENQALFEPLSGVRSQYRISLRNLDATDYFVDAEPFEIALDAYQQFYQNSGKFKFYQRLLESLGKVDLIEPLLKVYREQETFRKTLNNLHGEFDYKIKEEVRQRSNAKWNRTKAGLANQNKKRKGSSSVCPFQSSFKNQDDEEDNSQEQFDELLEKGKRKLEKNLQNINHVIEQQLQNRNIIVALCIYLNMTHFWNRNVRLMRFSRQNKELFREKQKDLYPLLAQTTPLILGKLKERYNNLASKEYITHYPDARGLWSESPPSSPEDLQNFAERFFVVRKDSLNYSPNSDFKNWGNCRLTLLLCAGGQPESRYLESEFRRELKRAARLNNRKNN